MMSIIDWRMSQCADKDVEFRFNVVADVPDIEALNPDVVIIATGGLPDTTLFEQKISLQHVVTSWDLIAGDAVTPEENILIYDESGDHPGLQAAEAAATAGATVEVMTPDRTFAPGIMAMNLSPYMKALQERDVTFTVARRLLNVERDGNRLKATIGTDYSDYTTTALYDQVVINYGTQPLADLYFDLKPLSINAGAIDHDALLTGEAQSLNKNATGKFRLYRIGDAVSSRNTHAAIYDALRLVKDI
jgi:pyruvate/2-oxoglutarate dehydrogenase complex dihydrolipoamide dehydrogenase (E3) component